MISPVSILIPPSSSSPPNRVEKTTTSSPKPKLEDFELGYSSLGVATVASGAFAAATLIPSSLQSFSGCAALGIMGCFWVNEAFSSSPNKEFSLAAKQLTLASLLLLPLAFYSFTLRSS